MSFDPQLLGKTHQWDHDFRPNVDAFFLEPACRLENGPDLHLRDFREHDPEATSAEAEHRVRLTRTLHRLEEPFFPGQERFNPFRQVGIGFADVRDERPILLGGGGANKRLRIFPRDPQLGHLDEQRLVAGQELVKRGVDQPDDDREPGHLPQDPDEILPLHATEMFE